MKITDMDIANAQIEYGGAGTSNIEITKNILNEWRTSKVIADMKEAQEYSLVKNTKIEEKTRNYEDADGHIIVNKYLSNVKTKTAQYRKSLLQKLDFTFAKPFLIDCEDDKYKEEWDKFLSDEVRAVIRKTAKEGINKGIGWTYPWIDEKGNLDLTSIDSITGYPAWSDEAHTELDAFVRDYEVTQYVNETPEKVYKVEYWDKEIVEKYIDYGRKNSSGGALEPVGDKSQETLRGLMYDTGEEELREGEERIEVKQTHMKKGEEGISWNRVPFIFLKGNEDELPLLNECKEDVDTYDLTKSKGIDSILDDIDAILVVEGIGAEMGELSRARDLVQKNRIMAIDPGGSAHFEKVSADITAIAQQLEIIKKDIQDNTNTVDMTTIALGSNPSGKAMRTFYEPLNIWANGFEEQFRVYMKNLKYFFDMWLSWKGGFGSFEELQKKEVTFTLDRDMLIDEQEIIQNINTSGDLLSTETKLQMHPYVDDVDKEMKRLDEDKKKQMEEQKENMELMNFGNTINNNNKLMNEKKQEMPKKEEKPEKQAKIEPRE